MAVAAKKIVEMRIFADDEGKMNRSLQEAGGAVLAVSQFTLAGSLEKGRRPSFVNAEDPALALEKFSHFVEELRMQIEDPDGNVLRFGSEPKPDQPLGEWRDMHGNRWAPGAAGGWTRVS